MGAPWDGDAVLSSHYRSHPCLQRGCSDGWEGCGGDGARMVQWKQKHGGSKCPFVLGHEAWEPGEGDEIPRAAGEGSSRVAAVAGAFGWLLPELLSFPQSLQLDKEALQEGRGTAVKYRRTPDGYIQIGTAGWGW